MIHPWEIRWDRNLISENYYASIIFLQYFDIMTDTSFTNIDCEKTQLKYFSLNIYRVSDKIMTRVHERILL